MTATAAPVSPPLVRRRPPASVRRRRLLFAIANHSLLIAVAIAFLAPFAFILLTSLMTTNQALSSNLWPHPFRLRNFVDVFTTAPLWRWTLNTLQYSVLATIEAKRWAREHDLDVMLVNGGPGGVLLMADPGVPIVYSLYHTYEQVARLTPSQRWKSVMTLIEIRAYARATVVTASAQSTAASLRDGIGVCAPIESIRCGVDFDACPPVFE